MKRSYAGSRGVWFGSGQQTHHTNSGMSLIGLSEILMCKDIVIGDIYTFFKNTHDLWFHFIY